GQTMQAAIRNISLKEKSGFALEHLSANLLLRPQKLELKELVLETPYSNISDYLAFEFGSLADFSDFESRVVMEGHFQRSSLASKDIARFAPGLRDIDLTAGIDGNVTGSVNNLRANNLMVTLGRSTYLRGDYRIRGLPDLDRTLLRLDLNTLSTNKDDI